jgi:endonuclease III
MPTAQKTTAQKTTATKRALAKAPTKKARKPELKTSPARIAKIIAGLQKAYPGATCALLHRNPWELLVATILSAQCTDVRVNMVTPELFRRFPDPARLARADQGELEELIRSTGFFRAKSRSLVAMARKLAEDHGGMIPRDLEALTTLPGVGRKTANVVLGTAFGIASGVVVDTHVKRLARRLGLASRTTPEQIEQELMQSVPRALWVNLSHRLIHHGRRVCLARRPRCEICSLARICPKIGVAAANEAKKSQKVERTAVRKRRSGSTAR